MTRRRLRAALGGALVAGAAAVACSHVSTDPNAVLSLELRPPQLPSIVLGDSLHDTTGAVDSLHAFAYNAQGDPVPTAPIRFIAVAGRARIVVDSLSGQVVGLDTGLAQVLAAVGFLQTLPQPVPVVLRPDTLSALDSTAYALDYNKSTLRDTLLPLPVLLRHLTPIDSAPIGPYRLEFAFTYPAGLVNTNPANVQLVNSANVPQLVDTTTTFGQSRLALRATLLAANINDSVGVNVFAYRPDHTPVPGSPVHFVISLNIH